MEIKNKNPKKSRNPFKSFTPFKLAKDMKTLFNNSKRVLPTITLVGLLLFGYIQPAHAWWSSHVRLTEQELMERVKQPSSDPFYNYYKKTAEVDIFYDAYTTMVFSTKFRVPKTGHLHLGNILGSESILPPYSASEQDYAVARGWVLVNDEEAAEAKKQGKKVIQNVVNGRYYVKMSFSAKSYLPETSDKRAVEIRKEFSKAYYRYLVNRCILGEVEIGTSTKGVPDEKEINNEREALGIRYDDTKGLTFRFNMIDPEKSDSLSVNLTKDPSMRRMINYTESEKERSEESVFIVEAVQLVYEAVRYAKEHTKDKGPDAWKKDPLVLQLISVFYAYNKDIFEQFKRDASYYSQKQKYAKGIDNALRCAAPFSSRDDKFNVESYRAFLSARERMQKIIDEIPVYLQEFIDYAEEVFEASKYVDNNFEDPEIQKSVVLALSQARNTTTKEEARKYGVSVESLVGDKQSFILVLSYLKNKPNKSSKNSIEKLRTFGALRNGKKVKNKNNIKFAQKIKATKQGK